MSKKACLLVGYVAVIVVLFWALPAVAEDEGTISVNTWHHSVSSMFWLTAGSGDATLRGMSTHVDKSLSDAWDKLSNLDMAVALRYEGGKGRIGAFADIFYVRLEYDRNTNLGPTELKPSTMYFELGGMYTVWGSRLAHGTQAVTAYAGARYTSLAACLKADAAGIDDCTDRNWTDGFIGARYRRDLLPWLGISLRGDLGAGGSEFTWNALGAVEFRTTKLSALSLGWRILDQDYSTGSGAGKFVYDMRQSGPFLSTRISF